MDLLILKLLALYAPKVGAVMGQTSSSHVQKGFMQRILETQSVLPAQRVGMEMYRKVQSVCGVAGGVFRMRLEQLTVKCVGKILYSQTAKEVLFVNDVRWETTPMVVKQMGVLCYHQV